MPLATTSPPPLAFSLPRLSHTARLLVRIMDVLPASPNRPSRRANGAADRFLTALVIASMLYTLLLGWGVLSGIVPFQWAYLLMALPCAAPIAWYGYGFLKINESEQDFGLLFSALGWGFIAIGLLVRHVALSAALRSGTAAADPEHLGQSTAATICTVIGLLCIVAGAAFALHAFSRSQRGDET